MSEENKPSTEEEQTDPDLIQEKNGGIFLKNKKATSMSGFFID